MARGGRVGKGYRCEAWAWACGGTRGQGGNRAHLLVRRRGNGGGGDVGNDGGGAQDAHLEGPHPMSAEKMLNRRPRSIPIAREG